MKSCSACQAQIPEGSRFCPQCGSPQSIACPACGEVNSAGSRFCAQCGAKLGAAAASAAPAKPVAPPPPAPRASSAAERRQLTVMFCDLVGSTALSTRLDPEDLREVIAAYHKCAAATVARFNGFVAKYMGDGVLVYFGYPEAHEADASHAVRAGLALIEAISKLEVGAARHQVRIGIATGLVVVGELVGTGEAQERNVVGETPNLAARLQSVAAPNTVLIAASTRRLTGDLFEYEAVDPGALKGFDGPVAAWRVLREQSMQSRFEQLRAANQVPLVGREEELDLLSRRWAQAKGGEGRVVLLSGEPGIGKSRLIASLVERVDADGAISMRYFCLPHQQGSALQPIVAQLSHAADFGRDDTPAVKRGKLEKLLGEGGAGAIADLLGLGTAADTAADPQRKRAQVFSALLDQLSQLAGRGPVLMVFEDVHWSDPTSIELLTLTVERLQALPVLLVITFRPDFQPPWAGQPHVTTMTLNRLGRRERMAMVEHVTGGKVLPAALLEQIVERTDGVPLFVEELTKAVMESEQLDEPSQALAIPTTLQASLMSRVDRLGSAREVLQIGAAIGREFSYDLLAVVAGLPDQVLQDALARLTEAELVLPRGTPPNATYSFKHALVQDTAYSTMLRARRQQLHAAIAVVLEKRFPGTLPEMLAQQFEGAGNAEQAIRYWRQAGDRDLRRFAMKEALAHYNAAFRLLASIPEGPPRDGLELDIRLGLGLVQLIAIAPSAKEVAEHYGRALALSRTLPDRGHERFLATWGSWFNATTSGRGEEAVVLSDQLLKIARELDNADFLLEAYHARVPMLLRAPDFAGMSEAACEAIRLYDPERHREHAYYFGGHDALMCARSFYALSLWGQGFFDQSESTALQSIEDARTLGHVFSVAHALQRGGLYMALMKDVKTCRVMVDELYPLAERNKFPWQLGDAKFLRGWLTAQAGDFDAGIEGMTSSIAQLFGGAAFGPTYAVLIVEQELRAGYVERALARIERAVAETGTKGNWFCAPELFRTRGEALRAQAKPNDAEAERDFREALAVSRKQSCRPLELRAATSLAKLLRDTGRAVEARELLAPVFAAFTEGFDRPDMQTAKTLLAELN
jgi:class 3 adenylate cyclase/predicted ATPase